MCLHELTDAVVELGALAFNAPELRSSDILTSLGVPDDRVLHQMAVGFQQFSIAQFKPPGTPCLEDIIGIAEIRRTIFNNASQRRKDMTLRLEGRSHTCVNRQPTEVAIP